MVLHNSEVLSRAIRAVRNVETLAAAPACVLTVLASSVDCRPCHCPGKTVLAVRFWQRRRDIRAPCDRGTYASLSRHDDNARQAPGALFDFVSSSVETAQQFLKSAHWEAIAHVWCHAYRCFSSYTCSGLSGCSPKTQGERPFACAA